VVGGAKGYLPLHTTPVASLDAGGGRKLLVNHCLWVLRSKRGSPFLIRHHFYLALAHVCCACAYKLYTYAEYTVTNCKRMLSIRLQIVSACWACAYKLKAHAEHTLTNCGRMLSIRVQFFRECSACAYKLWSHAEHTLTIHERMLSMRVRFLCVR